MKVTRLAKVMALELGEMQREERSVEGGGSHLTIWIPVHGFRQRR